MKIKILLVSCAIIMSLTGCGTISRVTNPGYVTHGANGPVTNNAVPPTLLEVSPSFLNASNTISSYVPLVQGLLSATPAAPVAPYLPDAANYIFGAIGGALALYARYKNNQATTQTAAAAALAQTVHNANLQTAAYVNASSNNSSATVAAHLLNAAKPV